MKYPDVLIAVPNTGTLRTELVEILFEIDCHVMLPINKPIDCNRNFIVHQFLKTDCKWLLMIDSDVVPPIDIIGMKYNDVPVCSAHVSTTKNWEVIPVGMMKDPKNPGYHHDFEHSKPFLHKVDVVGTGCIMIRRDVLENMEPPYFKFVYNEHGMLINGEDFDFCERVDDVYFDARYKCRHYVTWAI